LTRKSEHTDDPVFFSISQLAGKFGLSRGTLLHYDAKGLLKPMTRADNNYRVYGADAVKRLARICTYRDAGLTLDEIAKLLKNPTNGAAQIMEKRLESLNDEIARLRAQQRVLIHLLRDRKLLRRTRTMDKDMWVDLLRKTGLSEEEMDQWHIQFEKTSPQSHQDFLEWLGIPPDHIKSIRKWSASA